jgi:hypothetical protein
MILQFLFLLQVIKHKEVINSAEILELLWHAYVSKLVRVGFRINCNYMRNYHLNCALCHNVYIMTKTEKFSEVGWHYIYICSYGTIY